MLPQAGEAIERAEQGKGLVLVSQFPKPNSEVRQLTWSGAGRRSRGNPPKKRKPCKRASAGVVRLPCRPTCCHSGGHPVYYRHGAESQSREQGGNLGKTRTKASQAVGSEGPRKLSWDSQFGVLECCGVIFLSLGIGPYIQKYLIDEPRHKKKLFNSKPHLKLQQEPWALFSSALSTEFALLHSWDPFSLGIRTAELVLLFLSCQIPFSSRSTSLCALRPSGSGMGSCLLLLLQWMRQ